MRYNLEQKLSSMSSRSEAGLDATSFAQPASVAITCMKNPGRHLAYDRHPLGRQIGRMMVSFIRRSLALIARSSAGIPALLGYVSLTRAGVEMRRHGLSASVNAE